MTQTRPQPLTSAEKAVVIAVLDEHLRLLKGLGKERLVDAETQYGAVHRTEHALSLMQRS